MMERWAAYENRYLVLVILIFFTLGSEESGTRNTAVVHAKKWGVWHCNTVQWWPIQHEKPPMVHLVVGVPILTKWLECQHPITLAAYSVFSQTSKLKLVTKPTTTLTTASEMDKKSQEKQQGMHSPAFTNFKHNTLCSEVYTLDSQPRSPGFDSWDEWKQIGSFL